HFRLHSARFTSCQIALLACLISTAKPFAADAPEGVSASCSQNSKHFGLGGTFTSLSLARQYASPAYVSTSARCLSVHSRMVFSETFLLKTSSNRRCNACASPVKRWK